MLHFLEIYIYKNTKNDHQCHSILSWVRNKIFKKWKKISWRYYHQIMIICFLVSEILTAMNGFFLCHFGSILLFCPNNGLKNQVPKIEKKAWRYNLPCVTKITIWLMYSSWDTECDKKKSGDIILHLHNKNLDDMIYSIWNKEHDGLELANFGHFLPLYPLKIQKIRI